MADGVTQFPRFCWPYATQVGFDMDILEARSDAEIIAAMADYVNKLVTAWNDNVITQQQLQGAVAEMEQEWANVKDTFPEQIQTAVKSYMESDEFKGLVSDVVATEVGSILGNPMYIGFCTPDSDSDNQANSYLYYSTNGVDWASTSIASPFNALGTQSSDPNGIQLDDGRVLFLFSSFGSDHTFKHCILSQDGSITYADDNPDGLQGMANVWAPSPFRKADGSLAMCVSAQTSGTVTDMFGDAHPDMRIYVADLTVNQDGTLTCGTFAAQSLTDGTHTCYIDASIAWAPSRNAYVLIAKNQHTVQPDVFTGSLGGAWTMAKASVCQCPYMEAPKILSVSEHGVAFIVEHYRDTLGLVSSYLVNYFFTATNAFGQPVSYDGYFSNMTHFCPCPITDSLLAFHVASKATAVPLSARRPAQSVNVNTFASQLAAMHSAGMTWSPFDGVTLYTSESATLVELPLLGRVYADGTALDVVSSVTAMQLPRRGRVIVFANSVTRTVVFVPYMSNLLTCTFPANAI